MAQLPAKKNRCFILSRGDHIFRHFRIPHNRSSLARARKERLYRLESIFPPKGISYYASSFGIYCRSNSPGASNKVTNFVRRFIYNVLLLRPSPYRPSASLVVERGRAILSIVAARIQFGHKGSQEVLLVRDDRVSDHQSHLYPRRNAFLTCVPGDRGFDSGRLPAGFLPRTADKIRQQILSVEHCLWWNSIRNSGLFVLSAAWHIALFLGYHSVLDCNIHPYRHPKEGLVFQQWASNRPGRSKLFPLSLAATIPGFKRSPGLHPTAAAACPFSRNLVLPIHRATHAPLQVPKKSRS